MIPILNDPSKLMLKCDKCGEVFSYETKDVQIKNVLDTDPYSKTYNKIIGQIQSIKCPHCGILIIGWEDMKKAQ